MGSSGLGNMVKEEESSCLDELNMICHNVDSESELSLLSIALLRNSCWSLAGCFIASCFPKHRSFDDGGVFGCRDRRSIATEDINGKDPETYLEAQYLRPCAFQRISTAAQ